GLNAAGVGAQSAESNPVTPALPRFELTVTKAGTGSGTMTSSIGGIVCGAVCAVDFDQGATVNLFAAPGSGATFVGWAGACSGTASCSLTMNAAKTVTATFNEVLKPAVSCVVPKVKGKLVATAKRKIVAAHCRAGKVTRVKSRRVAK